MTPTVSLFDSTTNAPEMKSMWDSLRFQLQMAIVFIAFTIFVVMVLVKAYLKWRHNRQEQHALQNPYSDTVRITDRHIT
jgi:uncharacterized phage infection (PIP) family protein YhgE